MGLFNKNKDAEPLSERQQLESRYNSSRHNILLVLVFTAVNIVLLLLNQYSYFVFSAFIPYAIVFLGKDLCGQLPPDYYEGNMSMYEFYDSSFLTIAVAIAAVICGLYLLCWFCSKKRVAWMIIALVLFALDTVLMFLGGISADSFLDVVFHAWVIVSLTMGIVAHCKLKKLPEEEPASTAMGPEF